MPHAAAERTLQSGIRAAGETAIVLQRDGLDRGTHAEQSRECRGFGFTVHEHARNAGRNRCEPVEARTGVLAGAPSDHDRSATHESRV